MFWLSVCQKWSFIWAREKTNQLSFGPVAKEQRLNSELVLIVGLACFGFQQPNFKVTGWAIICVQLTWFDVYYRLHDDVFLTILTNLDGCLHRRAAEVFTVKCWCGWVVVLCPSCSASPVAWRVDHVNRRFAVDTRNYRLDRASWIQDLKFRRRLNTPDSWRACVFEGISVCCLCACRQATDVWPSAVQSGRADLVVNKSS